MPAITSKLYHEIVNEIVRRPFTDPERHRLEKLQRQLAEAQQILAASKTLDVWLKAG